MTDRKKYGILEDESMSSDTSSYGTYSSSDDSASEESYDLRKDIEETLGYDYNILAECGIWQKKEEKTAKKRTKKKKDTYDKHKYIAKRDDKKQEEEFKSLPDDKILYVEKDGELKECNYYDDLNDIYRTIKANNNRLYYNFTSENTHYKKATENSYYSSTCNSLLKFDDIIKNINVTLFVEGIHKVRQELRCPLKDFTKYLFGHYDRLEQIIKDNTLELNNDTIKKYKFYLKDNDSNVFQRIIVSRGEDGILTTNIQPIIKVNGEIQESNGIQLDNGDITQEKLQDCAIEGMKRCVKILKNKKNILEKDRVYLDLLIQIHNTNYNAQEYKQEDYIRFEEREFYDEKSHKSKQGYYFDIKDQNDIPKRYYFFNIKKKNELIKLMQSCDELIAENKLEVDNIGNIGNIQF